MGRVGHGPPKILVGCATVHYLTNNWPVCSLILKKISKIGTNRCQIVRLKCTKVAFRYGSAPDSAGRAYSFPPDLLFVFKGTTSKGRERKGAKGKVKWREGDRRWRK